MIKIGIALLVLLLVSSVVWALDPPADLTTYAPTLTWCPSVGATSYKVYIGTSPGIYNLPSEVSSTYQHQVKQLGVGTYYFAVTALNATEESDKSNEVSLTILPSPLVAPTITSVSASFILTTEATVIWTTNHDCSGVVFWGTDPSRWTAEVSNNLGTTEHLSRITGLTRRTHYLFKVQSVCDGQTIESGVRSFNTK